jgi:hypothetical protein
MNMLLLSHQCAESSHGIAENRKERRIRAALGLPGDPLPRVDEDALHRYYEYLTAHLSFPLVAYYPPPSNPREEREFRCEVLELLNPRKPLGDQFDGIFCKTRKGRYILNLPLFELEIPQHSANFELVEDYWYWFWNWQG